MIKKDAIKKIEKLNHENAKDIQASKIIWTRIENRKYKIESLKREFNIGNTILDEALLDYYKGKAKTLAVL
jgi:hypothetical protein